MRLDGVRVLDLTRLLPGPYATQLLADAGADVIKIEEPTRGDYARAMTQGEGPSVFSAVNRGKRSVTLDLKTEAGKSTFYHLASDADVVIEGFRPGVVERLDIGYETVREHNPGIVYCSLSGFGASGPYRDRVGHDLSYIALGGLLDMTRAEQHGRPAIPGIPVADLAGGMFAAFAVVSALLSRELGNGDAQHLDIGLLDVVLNLVGAVHPGAVSAETPQARRTPLTGQFPCYDVYETADGGYVTLAALEPGFWRTFCEAVDRPDLIDRHFEMDPEDRAEVKAAVAEVFRERPREHWARELADIESMVAPVRSVSAALNSEQAAVRDLRVDEGTQPRIASPLGPIDGTRATEETVPGLGEHTEEVLTEFDLPEELLAELRAADAI